MVGVMPDTRFIEFQDRSSCMISSPEKTVVRHEKVAILDYGSQYTQLIAQRVREQQVYCEIIPCTVSAEQLRKERPIGIILSGGPSSVYDEDAPGIDPEILRLGIPVLGICYGMQLVCRTLGAHIAPVTHREYGRAVIRLNDAGQRSPLFKEVSPQTTVWMSHGDQVTRLSDDFELLAVTDTCPNAAVSHRQIPFYGIQFHPEVTHTAEGTKIIVNFVREICRAAGDWTTKNFVTETIEKLRERIGNERVICGLSGGVDSAVVAAFISRAVGDQLTCICVDNGLMRKNEVEGIADIFTNHFKTNLVIARAEERFLSELAGVSDPQRKRKIIGAAFIDVFTEEAKKVHGAKFLAQGTIYPDIIESGGKKGGPASTIKFHHNVGGLPDDLEFELIEPLRELFKGDTRRVGLELGLPEELVWRHPFPGPGLAVRCLGAVTKEDLATLREADYIVVEEIRKAGLYRETSQAFAVLLPVKSVGVMGDGRTYERVIAVRSVSTQDFMTADWSRLPYDVLARISTRIINEVNGVNRVVYDISSKPPATIEWE